jgi:hypothetical protein
MRRFLGKIELRRSSSRLSGRGSSSSRADSDMDVDERAPPLRPSTKIVNILMEDKNMKLRGHEEKEKFKYLKDRKFEHTITEQTLPRRVLFTLVMQTGVKWSPQGMHKKYITRGSSHNPSTQMDPGKLQASSGVDVEIHINVMQDTLLIIKRFHPVDISNLHHSQQDNPSLIRDTMTSRWGTVIFVSG